MVDSKMIKERDWAKLVSLIILCLFCLIIISLLLADVAYLLSKDISITKAYEVIVSFDILAALKLSLKTSLISLFFITVTAVPMGFALSRSNFPGKSFINVIVDVPLVLPPVVTGLSLLAFFGSPAGSLLKDFFETIGLPLISSFGIVLCQYLIAVPYSIRSAKASFDSVDTKLEDVARTLGASPLRIFYRITLPLARNGLVAGAVMSWARAIGVFGPLMVFIGTGPRVQVMPTKMWLELSIGNIEASLVIALVSVFIACLALLAVHKLVPSRNWS